MTARAPSSPPPPAVSPEHVTARVDSSEEDLAVPAVSADPVHAVFIRAPWQQTTITVFAAYFGVASESFIIDTDHWRHTFLLMGLMWGLIAASRNYRRREAQMASVQMAGARPPG